MSPLVENLRNGNVSRGVMQEEEMEEEDDEEQMELEDSCNSLVDDPSLLLLL